MLDTKYVDWHYEKEIRMWSTIDEREDGLAFHNFGDGLTLAEIVLGDGCTLTIDEVDRAIGPYASPVEIKKARRSWDAFEMELESVRHLEFDRHQKATLTLVNDLDYISLKPYQPPKQAPNDRCICGSGLKYKKCCYLRT